MVLQPQRDEWGKCLQKLPNIYFLSDKKLEKMCYFFPNYNHCKYCPYRMPAL